jgi:hypothetical protein
MKRYLKLSAILIISAAITAGCAYHNEEDLYPEKPACDTTQVTYSATIAPIMTANCNVCHNTVTATGGIITDTHAGLKKTVDDQRLWGAVDHQQGFIPMPQDAGKLSDCNLAKIKKWIDNGAPNN